MSSSDRRRKLTEKPSETNRKISSKDKGSTKVSEKEDKRSKKEKTTTEKEKGDKRTKKTDKKKEKSKEEGEGGGEEEKKKKREEEEEQNGRKKSKKEPKEEQKEEQHMQEQQNYEQYEDDFEQYESDFDEDADEADGNDEEKKEQKIDINEAEKDGQESREDEKEADDDPVKSSFLLRRIAEGGKLRTKELAKDVRTEVRREVNFDDERMAEELQMHSRSGQSEAKNGERAANLMDFYMELVGKREGKAQAFTQMPEHRLTIGTQTERAESETKETQRSGDGTEEKSAEKGGQQNAKQWTEGRKSGGTRRLNIFLKAVEHLVDGVLSLAHTSATDHRPMLQHNSNLAFSSRFSTFSMSNAFFKEGRLCAMAVKDPHTIAAVLFVPKSDDLRLHRKSFVAEFALENPELQPQRFLRCEQEVTVFRYAPDNFSAAFAGLKDGSILAWDLLADERSPQRMIITKGATATPPSESAAFTKGHLSVLLPCFDTAFCSLSAKSQGDAGSRATIGTTTKQKRHFRSAAIDGTEGTEMPSAIVAMEMLDNEMKAPGVLAQLVTLSESGTVRWWTALDNQQQRVSSVSFDFADQSPCEDRQQIKMVPLFATKCFTGRLKIAGAFATCMALGTKGKVLVGASGGQIASIGRGGGTENECMNYSSGTTEGAECEEIVNIRPCPSENGIFAVITSKRLLFFEQSVRVPLILFSFFRCSSALFFTVHGGEVVNLWKQKRDTERLQSSECDLRRELKAKVRETMAWNDRMGSAFVAFLLSNDQIQVHCLEKGHSSDNKNAMAQFIEKIRSKNTILL
ncbi:hypothetical protein niasHS_010305 [Heterodera schachtii]|uniref:Uncharacterized protein n=1 Tax=Heterodera schachtii TaxID=97005 RepID=A0ABD2J0Y4_HETSC